jgi:hypothetical protein
MSTVVLLTFTKQANPILNRTVDDLHFETINKIIQAERKEFTSLCIN